MMVDEDCQPYFESFTKWFDELVEDVHLAEERLFHDDAMLSGQFDLYCKVRGISDRIVIDIKTPQTHGATWQLQTAAYQWLLEHNGYNVSGRGVLMLHKQGKIAKFIEHHDYETSKKMYQGLLNAYIYFDLLGSNPYE